MASDQERWKSEIVHDVFSAWKFQIQKIANCFHLDADDLTQEFVLSLLSRRFIEEFDPARGSLRAFLATVIWRMASDRALRAKREKETLEQLFLCGRQELNETIEQAIALDRAEVVQHALRQLPEEERLLATLVELDFTHAAMTKELGISESALKKRLWRLYRKLRRKLAKLSE